MVNDMQAQFNGDAGTIKVAIGVVGQRPIHLLTHQLLKNEEVIEVVSR